MRIFEVTGDDKFDSMLDRIKLNAPGVQQQPELFTSGDAGWWIASHTRDGWIPIEGSFDDKKNAEWANRDYGDPDARIIYAILVGPHQLKRLPPPDEISEVTGDKKFDDMMSNISGQADSAKRYDQMMHKIKEPVTHSLARMGQQFFAIGDKLIDQLEIIATSMSPEQRENFEQECIEEYGSIGDWICQIFKLPVDVVVDIDDALAESGNLVNLVDFFRFEDPAEFQAEIRDSWEEYKNKNMGG